MFCMRFLGFAGVNVLSDIAFINSYVLLILLSLIDMRLDEVVLSFPIDPVVVSFFFLESVCPDKTSSLLLCMYIL